MIKIRTSLIWPGCAQGKYTVAAAGFILAMLYWGDEAGPLQGWGPFACIPVDPAGNGVFYFKNRRALPKEATHVWASCLANDFSHTERASAEIPQRYLDCAAREGAGGLRLAVLTDLHLAAKGGRVRRAIRATCGDALLLLGDLTNDGQGPQFDQFTACLGELMPDAPVLPVAGNHDMAVRPQHAAADCGAAYAAFKAGCLERAAAHGAAVEREANGRAYRATLGDVDVYGLECMRSRREFSLPDVDALEWLDAALARSAARWRIVLCHAPLIAHNPHRGDGAPYLNSDARLQRVLDARGNVIYLSGHTHTSANTDRGCVELDAEHGNLYINCPSVVGTDMEGDAGLMSPDWMDGSAVELLLRGDGVDISMRSINSGVRFPRGCYSFRAGLRGG